MARMERQKAGEQDAAVRGKNFEEVALGFAAEQAAAEAARCLNCKNAPCRKGCPVGVDIPGFIGALKNGDMEAAYRIIKKTNNLPAVCGRVCPQEEQCEKLCVRGKMEGAVAIGTLERYVADYFADREVKAEREAANGKRVAVIGSGPSGLTCAADLAAAGCAVTVFEAFHKPGGVLVYGIPEFRLPKDIVQKEIDKLASLGVEIKLNTVVGKTITVDELLEEYDGVFVGTGAGLPMFMGIPGEGLLGVISANEYLTRVNLMKAYEEHSATPVQRAKDVIVVGAGNVAMDAARTALRMGAENVTVVYRRSREEMPARKEELRHAEEEGVAFKLLSGPVEILGEEHRVRAVKCIKMELGEPDASGRRRPEPVAGSEFEIPCDMVIMALGTSPNPLLPESCKQLVTSKRGTIVVDEETMKTSIDGVYAGGDAVTGAATVILAMGAGKKAAKSLLASFAAQK